jgi:CRISPR-associated protein Csm4
MSLFFYRLVFKGPVRFGAAGIGLEETAITLPSDGLTSAFLNALAAMEQSKTIEAFISDGNSGNPPAVFSSLFPYGPDPEHQGEQPPLVYALPKPLNAPPVQGNLLPDYGKRLKALAWLRPADAARWLNSTPLSQTELESIFQRSERLAAPRKDDANEQGNGWYTQEIRPRVALDRQHFASQLWACAAVHFSKGAGLYGLVRLRDDWQEKWLRVMQLLGEMGLGGERTYGFGEFQVEGPFPLTSEWEFLSANSGRYLLLSSYYPAETEKASLAHSLEAWDIVERRGYIVSGRRATTLKRHRVRLMVAGSVLKRPLIGSFADVTPNNHEALGLPHRVYRCGLAFTLPLS